jgi:UTP--glucose-1-phosphate uridylyltransferase
MKTTKAVITAAAPSQRTLPLQTLMDRDGGQKSVLCVIIEEALRAGIEDICLIICPGDESGYRQAAGEHADRLQFVPQAVPLGYGHAVWCARNFVGREPFLHMIGDHVYIAQDTNGCAQQLIEIASAQSCSVSGVQSTREGLLPCFGTIGGQRLPGANDLYLVERVLEKPTPTEAEQKLLIPGLRAGHYLCFFGMHVFTPTIMELLDVHVRAKGEQGNIQLSPVLAELAVKERYLAVEVKGRRYPVDARYGLLAAQIALALSGCDRNEVLALLCELLAQRELDR